MLIAKAKIDRKWKLAIKRKFIKKNNTNCGIKDQNIKKTVKWIKKKHGFILNTHKGVVNAVAVTHDSKYVVSGAQDGGIRVWNIQKKFQEATLEGHTGSVFSIAISFDNEHIISGSGDRSIRIWNLKEKRQETVLQGHTDSVYTLAITPDNKCLISGGGDHNVGEIIIWNLQSKCQEFIIKRPLTVCSIRISHNSDFFVSGSGYRRNWGCKGEIIVWNFQEKRKDFELKDLDSSIYAVAITPDDKYIVYGFNNLVKIWNLQEKRHELTFKGHTGRISSLAISHDSKYIVSSAYFDRSVRVWNFKNKRQQLNIDIYHPLGYSNGLNDVALTTDNKYIISGSDDCLVRIINLEKKTNRNFISRPHR